MRRIMNWLLFETAIGDRLLGALERGLGLAITPVETIDEAATVLLQSLVA